MHPERTFMTILLRHHQPSPQPARRPPGHQCLASPSRAFARRRGFSYLEVLISVGILATALVTMIGSIFSLHLAHESEREDAVVQQLANAMVERVMGANFATLGQSILATVTPDQNAWSWQRRATLMPNQVQLEFGQTDNSGAALTVPVNPPLSEHIPTPTSVQPNFTNDLISLGIEPGLSGLNGLRVYVEYYNMNILLNQQGLSTSTASPHTVWVSEVGDPTLTDPTTSPPTFKAGSAATYVPTTVGPVPSSQTPPLNIFQPEYSGVTPIASSAPPLQPAVNPVQINLVAPNNASALADIQAAMNLNSAVMVRILVFWVAQNGGGRWHEVVIMRRGDS